MSMVGMLLTTLSVVGKANVDEAVAAAGDGAADVEQVVLGIDLRNAKVLDRDLIATHPAAHAHALHDARREGRRADGAGRAVEHRAVRLASAAESVALDDALEAFALRLADHVDRVAGLEDVDLHTI